MDERISRGLLTLFDKHRIVFWYDDKRELRDAYEAVDLPHVEKIEIDNNEFGIKYRILREEPKTKFLLYHYGPEPEAMIDNWLLDVQLAQGQFRTDQVAIWLTELGLGIGFSDILKGREEFFRSAKRMGDLKAIITSDDTPNVIQMKMLAVCVNTEPSYDAVVEALLSDLAEDKDDKFRLIKRSCLNEFLWKQLDVNLGYHSKEPSVGDFAIELFKSCYAMETDGEVTLSREALVFFKRWKNNRANEDSFEKLSEEFTKVLNIKSDLEDRDFRKLMSVDYFEEIDKAILRNLVHEVTLKTAAKNDVSDWIRKRRRGHWYRKYEDLYEAVEYASEFLEMISNVNLGMDSLSDGIHRYSKTWYKVDLLYRKYIYHVGKSAQPSLMGELSESIENLYTNNFLLKVNDAWQVHVDTAETWSAAPVVRQRDFFARHVAPLRNKGRRACVVISDALRYEIADELLARVRSLDKYDAELAPALSMLPSYTQLGMASLLPNKDLEIRDTKGGTVYVDGQSSQGLANRQRILKTGCPEDNVRALMTSDLLAMKGDEARAVIRENDIIYIYHNRIDATGDKQVSEGRVFEAAEETLDELIKLIKKLTSANATHLILTADHGFIYQNQPLDGSDFSGGAVTGEDIQIRDRRFIMGHGLMPDTSLRKFTSEQVGLAGDMEIMIPKSINRLRLKGSGSRYVHGGASLQEVVIPVLTIKKKRQSDSSLVDVEIIGSNNKSITSGQISILFYQAQEVTDKKIQRTLKAGIYAKTGELLSDSHELVFDVKSENPREREMPMRFLMSKKADEFNGQEVYLKLEEQHAGTSHYKEYKSMSFMLKRTFTNDFDF